MNTVAQPMEPIAVVGMACRFPGAPDVHRFWRNLVAGRESVTFLTPEQLAAAGVPADRIAHRDHVPAAPLMPDADLFDAELFGMTRHEAELCDPQIRAFLEVCHSAVESAGYDPFHLADSVGVFGTAGPNRYLTHHLRGRVRSTTSTEVQALNQPDYLATTVSYKLNLRGPSMTVLTACSSALAAVHIACQSLRYGECDAALAGGAVVDCPPGRGHLWTPGSVYTSDGHCRPFDAAATGTIFGSGAGVVLLKRLSDAIAAGDAIRAVVRGSALNNDGSDKSSFSAPSVSGQSAVVMEAMLLAGVAPADIGYVEAHATGTLLGDPVEIAALAEAYQGLTDEPLPAGTCPIGSVKSNIGHLNEAAGIAGLIKAVLALEREAIPASIGVTEVNPRLGIEKTPFVVNTALRPWPRDPRRARYAGVTSLGIGGTNVHAVLTEAPLAVHEPASTTPRVVVWSGRGATAESDTRGRLAAFFDEHGDECFTDAVATLQHGRTAHPVRAAAVCSSAADAARALAGAERLITGRVRAEPTLVYLFPGQGAHRPRMAAGLYGTVRSFTVVMDECLDLFEREGVPLLDRWLADDERHAGLDDPLVVQPLLFAVEYALAQQWRGWAPAPAALLGHSVGELAAAAVGGVVELPDAVRLVTARATAMRDHPVEGGMLAVAADEPELTELLTGDLAVAALNGPRQTVVCGPAGELAALRDALAGRGIGGKPLPVSHAFHHPGWATAAARFGKAFDGVVLHPPKIPLYSGRTGALVTPDQATDPGFWTGQLAEPVRFGPAADAVLAAGHDLLLEVGPGRTLGQLTRRAGASVVTSLPGGADDHVSVLAAAARLWVEGCPIDWTAAGQPGPRTRVDLPAYPYQRERYWIDPPAVASVEPNRTEVSDQMAEQATASATEPAAAAPDEPLTTVTWLRRHRPRGAGRATGTALVLLPAGDEAAPVLRAVQRAGFRVVRVRPGERYASGNGEYRVRLDSRADVDAVLADLAATGTVPDAFVHAVTVAPDTRPADAAALTRQLDEAYFSLYALARAAVLRPQAAAPRVIVVTTRSVDVTGAEPVDPAKATAHGLLRSLLAEAPHVGGCVVDVGDRVPLAELAAELALPQRINAVALRGRHRWVPAERPLPLPDAEREPIREAGVYLITGGFGGLGLAVAHGLAGTGLCPRLVLLGRHDPTTTGDERVGAALAELRALGAELHLAECDVSDEAALRAVVATATERFGPVHGVFHLAGLPGGQMIAFRQDADQRAVLAPKTAGTVNLDTVFADAPPLDFVVYFGSRAAVDGLVGGADYAAANAFLDGMAVEPRLAGGRVLSVNWPVWSGVGMAVESGYDVAGLARTVAGLAAARPAAPAGDAIVREVELGAATDWVLDEHRVNRVPLLPGTAYLDLLVRTFREDVTAADTGPVMLADVVFRAPFHDPKPRLLRLAFRPAGERYEFVVSSRPAGDESARWTDHVTGKAARATGGPPPAADVAAVRSRLAAAGAPLPRRARDRSAFVLGPRWQNLTEQWAQADEKLVRVQLPAAFHGDLARHTLHPALLDTVTAAVRGPGQQSTVPLLYRELVAYQDLPAEFYAHVHRDPTTDDVAAGDIDLVTKDGTVLVTVRGFTMRQVDLATFQATTEPAAPRAAVAGLDPAHGVDLLLRVLAAGLAGSVLVRPFSNGNPVPRPDQQPPASVVPPAPPVATSVPEPVRPGVDLDDRVRALWANALGVTEVRDDQDFFESGGNSLTAIDIMAQVRETLGVDMSIGLLLQARTFRELVSVLRENGAQ